MEAAGLVLLSYQDSLVRSLGITANNIANSTTTGFKSEDTLFDTFISRPAEEKDRLEFAVDVGTYRHVTQGAVSNTGNPLDVAVQGDGYFQIQTSLGTRYTRGGAFQLNSQGELVTASGDRVIGDGDQPLTLPQDARDILIAADGVVTSKSGTDKDAAQAGKLKLVRFDREQELRLTGNGFYSTTQQALPVETPSVVQGALEQSNVAPVREITSMIELSRSYQTAAKLLDLEGQRQTSAISRLGKVSAS